MTAKGKINASKVTEGHRIIVKVLEDSTVRESATKTGEGVQVARVLGKTFRSAQGPYEAHGKYVILTSAGTFEAAPIQTMWLAPEDPAGIKRAHAEALELDKVYEAYPLAEEGPAEEIDLETLPDPDGANDLPVPSEFFEQAQPTASTHTVTQLVGRVARLAPAPEVETTSSPVTGSTVIRLLERVWDRIRSDHPELPVVVITTGSGEGAKWGHFRADSWKLREEGAATQHHELFLASEALAKGAHQVLQTMLHEAAHTLAKVRDQKDTSRQGRWHNQVFRRTAEEMGLKHQGAQADRSHGFAFVTLTQATKDRYADLLAELDREIRLTGQLPTWLGGTDGGDDDKGGERMTKPPTGQDEQKTNSNNLKLTCTCQEPNIIRASRKIADKLVVRCDDCKSLFQDRS